MITLFKFLLGDRAVDNFANDEAWSAVGAVMLEKVKRVVPELRSMKNDKDYLLHNELIADTVREIFTGRDKELARICENVAKELNKILK